MTRLLMFLGVFCALVAVSMANIGQLYIGHAVNDEYPGQCYYEKEKIPIKIGESYISKKDCYEIVCEEEFVLHILDCTPYTRVPPECITVVDTNVLYPKCCQKSKCPY